jgi:hypothetical protein
VWIPFVFRGFGKGIPVHLFPDGMLYNFAGNLHEVALRGRAFCHESIMPRIAASVTACGNHTNPLPCFWVLTQFERYHGAASSRESTLFFAGPGICLRHSFAGRTLARSSATTRTGPPSHAASLQIRLAPGVAGVQKTATFLRKRRGFRFLLLTFDSY